MTSLSRRCFVALLAGPLSFPTLRKAEATDGEAGPFGLVWGASSEEVRKMGISLTATSGPPIYGTSFSASDLPKSLSDMEGATLFFGFDDKLWRVAAAGRTVGPDPAGGTLITRYQDLAASLAGRYGSGRETDARDREMWKGPNEYLMSLKMGRARRFTVFNSSTVDVELSIRASDGDRGYYLLLYEDRAGAARFTLQKRAKEKEAL